ncbi:hypothetical protein D9M71_600450 [compost metagenome]
MGAAIEPGPQDSQQPATDNHPYIILSGWRRLRRPAATALHVVLQFDAAIFVGLDDGVIHLEALHTRRLHRMGSVVACFAGNHNPDLVARQQPGLAANHHRSPRRYRVGVDHAFSIRFGNGWSG